MEYPEDVPPGLMLWRRAVHNAQSPAQLNLCTQLLGNSIAWEKSIMKVVSDGESGCEGGIMECMFKCMDTDLFYCLGSSLRWR